MTFSSAPERSRIWRRAANTGANSGLVDLLGLAAVAEDLARADLVAGIAEQYKHVSTFETRDAQAYDGSLERCDRRKAEPDDAASPLQQEHTCPKPPRQREAGWSVATKKTRSGTSPLLSPMKES